MDNITKKNIEYFIRHIKTKANDPLERLNIEKLSVEMYLYLEDAFYLLYSEIKTGKVSSSREQLNNEKFNFSQESFDFFITKIDSMVRIQFIEKRTFFEKLLVSFKPKYLLFIFLLIIVLILYLLK